MRTVIRYEENFDGLGIWIMQRDRNGVYCAKPVNLEMELIKDYPMFPEPTLRFTSEGEGRDFMRDMAEQLARNGLLPDIAKQNTAEVARLVAHLEDMRKLVFKNK